jgi:Methyltransferase domain
MIRKSTIDFLASLVDFLLIPFVIPAALCLKAARRTGLQRLPICRWIMMRIGVLPIRNHYYEPFPVAANFRQPLGQDRYLPGIDWNLPGQLEFLASLEHASELCHWKSPSSTELDFRLGNGRFESGDAEFLYQVIRCKKPRRLLEIGSGNSTLVALAAINRNRAEDSNYSCDQVCIEPYEAPWLEKTGAKVLRQRVEDVDAAIFSRLQKDDLLFIDSTHVIRPQGDVLTEYLEILPKLNSGVIVHIHDIFSPRDYPASWVMEQLLLWNEQYLLEAFLTENRNWSIIGALNLLKHRHFEALQRVCPYLTQDREPGSFYMRKN